MITVQDLFNIIGGKISNEMGKTIIRNSFPPQIAEQMCNAIDCNEKAELLLPIEFSKYIWLIKFKMSHKINLPLFESSKTRDSPRNPCHG